jgi:hypothetical protein
MTQRLHEGAVQMYGLAPTRAVIAAHVPLGASLELADNLLIARLSHLLRSRRRCEYGIDDGRSEFALLERVNAGDGRAAALPSTVWTASCIATARFKPARTPPSASDSMKRNTYAGPLPETPVTPFKSYSGTRMAAWQESTEMRE